MREYVIGVDVGGTRTKLGLFDGKTQLLSQQKYLTDKDATAMELMDILARQITAIV